MNKQEYDKRLLALEIGERIKQVRLEQNKTQREIAKEVNVAPSTIMRYEAGHILDIKVPVIKSIAQALHINPSWLMGYNVAKETTGNANVEFSKAEKSTKIPVYGAIPAGIPLEAIEDIHEYIDIPESWTLDGSEYMGLRVKGDSMYPKYMDGDTIVVKKQSTCESGQDAVVYVNDECYATLKKVVKNIDHVILQPLNPEYEPKMYEFTGEGCPLQIAGIVVEIRRKV